MNLFDFLVWSLAGGFWRFAGVLVLVCIMFTGIAGIVAALRGRIDA